MDNKQIMDDAVRAAQSLPDLIARLNRTSPELAAQFTGKPLIASKTPWGTLVTTGVTYLATRYGLGWDETTCDLVAGGALLLGAYVMRAISNIPISGLVRRAAPVLLVAALLPALGACASQPASNPTPVVVKADPTPTPAPTPPVDPIANFIAKLETVAIADLQAASTDAGNHGDLVAKQCYDGLVPIVQGIQANPPIILPPKPIGLVTTFQDARDIKAGVGGASATLKTLRQQINLACGALQIDIQAGVADPLSLFSGQ